MNLSVLVLHNVSADMFFRYDPETSRLFHAHEFQIVADNIEKAADVVWTLTNVSDGNHLRSMRSDLGLYAPQVDEYRQRRNRSLSVSDVLVFTDLDGRRPVGALAIESVGFRVVEVVAYDGGGSNQTAVSNSYTAHQMRAADPTSGLIVSGPA